VLEAWGPRAWGSIFIEAIRESCDVYFYEVGKRLGIDRIHKIRARSGDLAAPPGLGCRRTHRAYPEHRVETGYRTGLVSRGDLQRSIGQRICCGYTDTVALMTAAVSNRGVCLQPT